MQQKALSNRLTLKGDSLKLLYLLVGSASLLFFIWTGQYLSATYPNKQNMEMGFRVMLRSRHIFILLISLLEIGIGAYIAKASSKGFIFIQLMATLLLFVAHGLFIYAFFHEVEIEYIPNTPLIHNATYLALVSILLHFSISLEGFFLKKLLPNK